MCRESATLCVSRACSVRNHPRHLCRYALGSMIYEANALGWQFYSTPPSQLYYYLFIGFVCLCGLLAFVLLFMCW